MRFQTLYLVAESPLIKDVNVLTWERVESPWLHLQRNRAINMRMYRISRITYRLSSVVVKVQKNKNKLKVFLYYKDSGVQTNK